MTKFVVLEQKESAGVFLDGVVEVIADGDVNFIRLKDMLVVNKVGAQIIYKIRKDE